MIDIKLIRENPELVKENIKKKFQNDKLKLVDEIKTLDSEWRNLKGKIDTLRSERNKISKEVAEAKKSKDDKREAKLMKEAKLIPEKIKQLEEESAKLEEKIQTKLESIPNIMHPEVPLGKSDKENVESEKIGKPKEFSFKPKNHVELAENLKIANFEISSKVSGTGFYYLQGDLALLNQAVIKFAIDKMVSKGFTYMETPLMLRGNVIKNVTDLNDQTNQIYKIENEDLYLIGTSEHSLIGRFIDTLLHETDLPIKNTSYSMCFRKEIGSHGIEEKGLYRTHQFNKIEMIVICKPEDSQNFFEEMKDITIEIFKDLGIPVRVLKICSGDLGDLKNRQVDIEAWSPVKKEYYEVGSCSNLTEAQARRLKIRGIDKKGERFAPHTLNNTAVATSRALVSILENYQQEDGSIKIPDVLVPYMQGKKIISKSK